MHPYVLDNERAVEIPIALAALDDAIESARRDDAKALRAFQHLRTLLAPGGRALVTFPLGYNPKLDAAVWDGRLATSNWLSSSAVAASGVVGGKRMLRLC